MMNGRSRVVAAVGAPLLVAALAACDIVTADFTAQETAEWRGSYELQAGGRVEVLNVHGTSVHAGGITSALIRAISVAV